MPPPGAGVSIRECPYTDIRLLDSNVCFWPRLCEKSVRNEAVGKLFNFPLRLAVKRDEEWDCASKSGGFVSISPTGDMIPDFLHSLGRFLPHALQHHGVLS